MKQVVIQCDHVGLEQDHRMIIKGISLKLSVGITYVTGPNGSGKSAFIRLLTSVVPPTSGTVVYQECEREHPFGTRSLSVQEARSMIGYLPQHFTGYSGMSVKQYIVHQALQKGMSLRIAKRHIQAWLSQAGLWNMRNMRLGKLSGGQRQRVGLLQALIGNPRICLLDEPFEGLDIMEAMVFRHLIQKLAGSSTIVLSTHRLDWIEPHENDRIVEMDQGRIISVFNSINYLLN